MEESLALSFVTVEEKTDRYDVKRIGSAAPEEIEASIDSALRGKTCLRQLHIDTAAISLVSLYKSLWHVRGTLEQLRLDIFEDVPWSFLCKVVASCPKLRSVQLSCGALVGQFPSDLVLQNLVYLSLMPLKSNRNQCLPILSLKALSTLLKSVRSLETLIVGAFCKKRIRRIVISSTEGRIVVESESLRHLCMDRGNKIDIELRSAPNLETLRIDGFGNCVVHSTLDKLAKLEYTASDRASFLDFRCAPPPSLKSLVLHTDSSYNCRAPIVDTLQVVLENIESLFCNTNALEVLAAKCGAKLRFLGLIDRWYSKDIDQVIKPCQNIEKVYTECRCGALQELNFQTDTFVDNEQCAFCRDGNEDGALKPSLSTVVFNEVDTENWPATRSALPGDLYQDVNIDLSKISEEDWCCNLRKVDISSVKHTAKSLTAPFYFAGCLPQESSTSTIMYLRKDLLANSLVLPAKDEDIRELLEHCAIAVFGQDDKDVYDPTYRKSMKLDSTHFLSSFQPSSCGNILDKLKKAFCTDLIIEPHKLNVYRPGDFFKAHRDTPRDGLVGSLVVVLPGNHTGGELLVRHRGIEHCLRIEDNTKIHWAAFYSDCEHEVKELTSGFRLTLTYNLYRFREQPSPPSAELFDATSLPIYHELTRLKKLRGNSSILLGIACQYSYPFKKGENEKTSEEMITMLKGEDAMVFAASKAAGLKPVVVQVWECEEKMKQMFMTPTITNEFISSEDQEEKLSRVIPAFEKINKRDIVWVNKEDLDLQVGASVLRYGNESTMTTAYRAVAILMYVNVQDGEEDDVLKVRTDLKRKKDQENEDNDEDIDEEEEEDEEDEMDEEEEEESGEEDIDEEE